MSADVLQFRILGPLEVRCGQHVVKLGGRKQRTVLAVLLVHREDVVSTEQLIDAVWAEEPPATAKNALQVYVSQLRRSLLCGAREELIETRADGYRLLASEAEIDAGLFGVAASEGRAALDRGDAFGAFSRLAEALSLWRGSATSS